MSLASQRKIDDSMTAPGKDTIQVVLPMGRSLEVGMRRLSYPHTGLLLIWGERPRKGCGSGVVGYNTGRLFLWGEPLRKG